MASTLRLLSSVSVPAVVPTPSRVHVRVHASRTGETVLWESEAALVWPDGADRWTVALDLSLDRLLDGELFRNPVRFVSIWLEEERRWSDRTVLDGSAAQQSIAWHRLERRLAVLEAAWSRAGGLGILAQLRDAIDDHERRLAAIEAGAPVRALEVRTAALSGRLDRLDQDNGRLVRIEDELEDLVGPRGDVVDFEERLSRLERAMLGRSSVETALVGVVGASLAKPNES